MNAPSFDQRAAVAALVGYSEAVLESGLLGNEMNAQLRQIVERTCIAFDMPVKAELIGEARGPGVRMMDQNLKAKWVAALRSGEFEQAFCMTGHGKNCCVIGVGGVVAGLDIEMASTSKCVGSLGLSHEESSDLIQRNDGDRMPFPELADYIEANL